MRSTFKLLFYINRGKVRADGTTAVMCRISIDGKAAAITTGIYCQPSDWNAKKGEIKTERENNRLAEFRTRLEQTYDHILKEQGVVSSELLKNTIAGINSIPTYLVEAGKVEIERLRVRAIEINSNSTHRESRLMQSNLQEFLRSRGMEDIAGPGEQVYFGSQPFVIEAVISDKFFVGSVNEYLKGRSLSTNTQIFRQEHRHFKNVILNTTP